MHPGRKGTDTQKVIPQRLEMAGTKWIGGVWTNCSESVFTGIHSDYAQGSYSCVITDFPEYRRCFEKRFAELFKEEDTHTRFIDFQ